MVAAAADRPFRGESPVTPAITVTRVGVVIGAGFLPACEVTVRITLEGFSGSTVLVSISARSALILSLEDEPSNGSGGIDSDFLRVVSLPVAVDAARVTCELDGGDLVLTLPAGTDVPMSARTVCA